MKFRQGFLCYFKLKINDLVIEWHEHFAVVGNTNCILQILYEIEKITNALCEKYFHWIETVHYIRQLANVSYIPSIQHFTN